MGSITRGLSNNITTGGVILPAGITNASVADVTFFANASGGTLILLSTQTASNSATISFTTGLDSTYDEYQFKFINAKPVSNGGRLTFNLSTDGGSNYNVTKTTTVFKAYNQENGVSKDLAYDAGADLAQSTAFQAIGTDIISDSDASASGSLTLFNPSSTVYVKHFISVASGMSDGSPPYMENRFVAGYGNTTSAINAIQFKFDNSNITDGIFKMYGVKKS
jgi:hypothetical protein